VLLMRGCRVAMRTPGRRADEGATPRYAGVVLVVGVAWWLTYLETQRGAVRGLSLTAGPGAPGRPWSRSHLPGGASLCPVPASWPDRVSRILPYGSPKIHDLR